MGLGPYVVQCMPTLEATFGPSAVVHPVRRRQRFKLLSCQSVYLSTRHLHPGPESFSLQFRGQLS